MQASRYHRAIQNLAMCLPLFAALSAAAQSATLSFQSGNERTGLLELYTSEGCSSCPPAEAWLSQLKDSPRLWKDFAPVAFHVDYWNSLGWKDLWSNPEFTERQRTYAQLWRSENIYTPEFVLNGREWRNWFTGKNGPKSDGANPGLLSLTALSTNRWQAVFTPEKDTAGHYQIHAALLVGAAASDVKAGENKGRRLNHDFVCVDLAHIGMTISNGAATGKFILQMPAAKPGQTLALTAWVTLAGELEPLQATGGWLAAPAKK